MKTIKVIYLIEMIKQGEETPNKIQYEDALNEKLLIEEIKKDKFIKKTMIFKQEYLDIIYGLALIKDMQIKDVLNQLLEKAINELDDTTKEKALNESKESKAKDNITYDRDEILGLLKILGGKNERISQD